METLTQFTFNLILLFIPGLIVYFIFDNYTAHKDNDKGYNVIIISLLSGLLCYTVYLFILYIFSLFTKVSVSHKIIDCLFHAGPAPVKDIFLTSVLAIFLGLLLIFLENKKIVYGFLSWLKLSDKMSGGIWQYAQQYAANENIWVRIHDIEKDRLYEGKVKGWSEISEKTEILLTDVKVYINSTAQLLSEPEALFLRNDTDEFIIEFFEPENKLSKGDDSSAK